MRPPQNAGEDPRAQTTSDYRRAASMRPPQNAGEDVSAAAVARVSRSLQ